MTQQSNSETPAAPKGRTGTTQIAFVCVQNAGRSQMAYAFGQREIENRGLDGEVEVITGGTRPAEPVHDEVVRAMDAIDVDVAGRTPREITFEETQGSDYVIR